MGVRYFCDRCEKEFKSGGLRMPIYARDGFGARLCYIGDGYLCEKCTEKFNKIKDHIEYEEDFFTMTDEEIGNIV